MMPFGNPRLVLALLVTLLTACEKKPEIFNGAHSENRLRLSGATAFSATVRVTQHSSSASGQDCGEFSVRRHGVKGDGVTDDTAALQALGRSLNTLCFPPGVYVISAPIRVHSGTLVRGSGEHTIIRQTSQDKPIFTAEGSAEDPVKHLEFHSMKFEAPLASALQKTYAISISNGHHISVHHCHAETVPLLKVHSPNNPRVETVSSDIHVHRNRLRGRKGQGAAILFVHARDIRADYNNIQTYDSGIQYWGGNAATKAHRRFIFNFSAAHNIVRDVSVQGPNGGGIWGSRGRKIRIGPGNQVSGCADVCLDSEGDVDVEIFGNDVADAINAGIATFYSSQNVKIYDNRVSMAPGYNKAAIFFHGIGRTSDVMVTRNHIFVHDAAAISSDHGALGEAMVKHNTIAISGNGRSTFFPGGTNIAIDENMTRSALSGYELDSMDRITAAYQRFAGRNPRPDEIATWTSLAGQGHSRANLTLRVQSHRDSLTWLARRYLHREPTAAEIQDWQALLGDNRIAFSTLETDVQSSPEAIAQLYRDHAGRPPSPQETAHWRRKMLDEGWLYQDIVVWIQASDPTLQRLTRLHLGREAKPDEIAGWRDQLVTGQVDFDTLVRALRFRGFQTSPDTIHRLFLRYADRQATEQELTQYQHRIAKDNWSLGRVRLEIQAADDSLQRLARTYFGRDASPEEIQSWRRQLTVEGIPYANLIRSMEQVKTIHDLHLTYAGRRARDHEIVHWHHKLNIEGWTLANVTLWVQAHDDSLNRIAQTHFGRNATSDEIAVWRRLLTVDGETYDNIVAALGNGQVFHDLYLHYAGRRAWGHEIVTWRHKMDREGWTLADVTLWVQAHDDSLQRLARTYFGRDASPEEIQSWRRQLTVEGIPYASLIRSMEQVKTIHDLHLTYAGRRARDHEIVHWHHKLNIEGWTLANVTLWVQANDDSFHRLARLYLGRSATADEIRSWRSQLTEHGVPYAQLVGNIQVSGESVQHLYRTYAGRSARPDEIDLWRSKMIHENWSYDAVKTWIQNDVS